MLLPSDINPYSFSLAVSAVTSPSLTTSTLSLKTISRKSWRSNARCSTTTTPGSTSAFTSSPRQDTPSSPWTSSPWKNWTARYVQMAHEHTSVFHFAQKAHTPSPFPLSFPIVHSYCLCISICGCNPTSLSPWLVCISLRRGDLWSLCWGVDSQRPERIKWKETLQWLRTLPFQRIRFQEKLHGILWSEVLWLLLWKRLKSFGKTCHIGVTSL